LEANDPLEIFSAMRLEEEVGLAALKRLITPHNAGNSLGRRSTSGWSIGFVGVVGFAFCRHCHAMDASDGWRVAGALTFDSGRTESVETGSATGIGRNGVQRHMVLHIMR
jgi:hypothetical protein